MTAREDPPALPKCPRCDSNERVEVIAPPTHDPDARLFCPTDNLTFTGSQAEAFALKARDAAKKAERGELDRIGRLGRDLGVIGDKP